MYYRSQEPGTIKMAVIVAVLSTFLLLTVLFLLSNFTPSAELVLGCLWQRLLYSTFLHQFLVEKISHRKA